MKGREMRKRLLALFLCFIMVLGCVGGFAPIGVSAAVNAGNNPTPAIDIAVNVPSDYPGTFLEFKEELTQKLLEQGLEPGSFRITDTKVSIDTTDLNGWYVYDHYYSQGTYDAMNLSDEQKLKQPLRLASDKAQNGTQVQIENYFQNGTRPNTVYNYNHHILSYQKDGTANMAFVGYATPAWADFMIYPAPSDSTRNFSFNLDASVLDTHTLHGGGFLMNAGIVDGKLYGYLLYYSGINTSSGAATLGIYKVNGVTPAANTVTTSYLGSVVASKGTSLGNQRKARISVELKRDEITVQSQAYDASGNLGAITNIYDKYKIPQVMEDNTLNGFGPFVGYSAHGCASLSLFQYTDLEMSYETTAFDALKNVQYYQGADYKYFVNLAGESNDPNIPLETDPSYPDGIKRLNENEIFYVSNVDDGKILTDTKKDEDGNIIHQGIGSSNGFIANGDDYAGLMAQYIYNNYIENVKFNQAPIISDIPLANFYMKDSSTGEQIMTIHLQHLKNSNQSIPVNIVDKSKPGTLAGDDGKISQWSYKVYDPKNTVVYQSGWVDSVDKLNDYIFNGSSASGRWTFELSVRDQEGNESKSSQTYLVAFLDNEAPFIKGENTGKNIATITLTDTGMGIDEDGITFMEDGRGSGVAAYWITNDNSAAPGEDDWEELESIDHSYAFDYEIDSNLPVIVWVKDECGNIGNKAIFQPIHVVVEDADGNPIDDYYVIGDNPIIVLPEDEDVPPSEDDEEEFSGWVIPGKNPGEDPDPITPGAQPEGGEDHTIIIRPSYSKDKAKIVYVSNGGVITTSAGTEVLTDTYEVTSGASIQTKIDDHNILPTREGYAFAGWKLLNTDNSDSVSNSAYINNAANLLPVETATAVKETNEAGITTRDTYYLIAQWTVGNYTLKLDANGGSLGNVRSITDIAYGTSFSTLAIPIQGRGVPTKAGYIFQGWSETSTNDNAAIFKFASGISGTAAAMPVMPAHDKTVYAVWKEDTSKFVVSFNSNGGSRISDQAYQTATAAKYNTFLVPQRAGYTFDGWYMKSVLDAAGEDVATNENGILSFVGDAKDKYTAYAGGENIEAANKVNHTFVAMWTPKTDVKYTVDSYINSGKKDANGKYIYTKVSETGVTKTYTAATEEVVSVQAGDKTAELTVGGTKYWYNEDNENNVLTGAVTGSPALSLKLYYDRYFDVTATSKGEGTVTGAAGQKEGSTPTVSWKAADGWYVSKVLVDGVVKDDLISEESYTFPEGIHENHRIYVEFENNAENPNPNPPTDPDDPNPNPGGDTTEKFYRISTAVIGCSDSSKYEITPTTSVKSGDNLEVSWNVKDSNYQVVKVEVDGLPYSSMEGPISFTGIKANHDVVVTVEALPTIGGGSTEGQYTVTVNRYGGDSSVTLSPSQVVDKGAAAAVSWDATGTKYRVYKVVVDGEEVTIPDRQKVTGTYKKRPLTNIQANHVVDVYFAEVNDENEVIPPSFSEEEYVKLTTQIIGGSGEITGGAVISKDEEAGTVSWDLRNPDVSHADEDDYTYYEVEKVVVNGEVREDLKDKTEVTLGQLADDTDVKVYLKPVLFRVEVIKYGNGTVPGSRTVYKYQNYKDLVAEAAEGSAVAKIVVDGETVYEYQAAGSGGSTTTKAAPAKAAGVLKNTSGTQAKKVVMSEAALKTAAETKKTPETAAATESVKTPEAEKTTEASEKTTETGKSTETSKKETESGKSTEASEKTTESGKSTEVSEKTTESGKSTEASEKTTESGKSTEASEKTTEASEKTTESGKSTEAPAKVEPKTNAPKVNVPKAQDTDKKITKEGEEQVTRKEIDDILRIEKDHKIEVYFAEKNDDGTLKPIPDTSKLYKVTAEIVGGSGTVEGQSMVEKDGSVTIKWSGIPEGYEVEKITVNDNVTQATGSGSLQMNDITENKTVKIYLKKSLPGDTQGTEGTFRQPSFNVTTAISGGNGTITGNHSVTEGSDTTVTWSVADPETEEVKYVFVNGQPNTAAQGEGSVTIEGINADQKVVVVLGKKDSAPPTNVDTDGDGKPDINIDKDGDGKPEVNVDTDGDGDPDLNEDKDGDGEPDVNIVDKDGDGKPDPIDPEDPEPPKPNVNVDTDGDGDPDLNVDKDGDGKPDVNIVDKDGDGKPDPIDPEDPEPPKPNVNVDTDGDGDPDLNVDKDGDGKPDINIVDKDGDGEPDDIDPENPPKPDVNVDTDGDGKPDINVDKDGDGKPDVNIVDKDGDGEADKDIDPENPPKPDVNVDTNGDGLPDINIDEDGDGKPDVNIDEDGDGKPDKNIVIYYIITTSLSGGEGTIDPTHSVRKGNDTSVSWTVKNSGTDEVKYVFVNGKLDTAAKAAGRIEFKNLGADQKVVVVLGKKGSTTPPVNVDVDGDGKPDINIDKDGDGKPDVDVDTDGDGKPDINIDKDGDGKPDINIDTDGDGKPDVDIDTNGDGKPDTNIDTNGDGKPDVNIDKNGDGKPDINIDTNGDGKPDINIDTDGDGKPDLNIDTDGDNVPDVNIDTDGDGKPDKNVIGQTEPTETEKPKKKTPKKKTPKKKPTDPSETTKPTKPTGPSTTTGPKYYSSSWRTTANSPKTADMSGNPWIWMTAAFASLGAVLTAMSRRRRTKGSK